MRCSVGSCPLAALLRNQVAADDELRRLQDELKAHVFRGVAWFDDERRRIATGRLHRLLPTLPRQLSPAAYTRATFDAEFGVPPYYPHAHDVRAAMLAHHMRGRLCQILMAPFDALRVGEFSAAGFVPGGNGAPAAVPPVLWSTAEVVFDRGVGALLVSNVVVFAGVEVSAPPRGAGASGAALAPPTPRRPAHRMRTSR